MSAVILSYGAKLVRENQMPGPNMLSFIMCQLALGPILTVSVYILINRFVKKEKYFILGHVTNLFSIKNCCRSK